MSTVQTSYHLDSQEKHKRKAWIITLIIHALIILITLFPWFKFQDPPPEKQGILVSLGTPNMGSGDSRPKTQNIEKVQPTPPSEEKKAEEVKPVPNPSSPPPTASTPKKVVTTEDPNIAAIKKQKREDQLKRQKEAEAEAQRRAAEEQAKREAEAEAARKKAEYEKSKDQFGDLFGGSGKGKTDKPGNQGDPNGDPDASNLEGISSGSGRIGGGLGGRGVLNEPTVVDNSQKTGKVVIKVCVGSSGNVVSADFTQRGSTTTDSQLIDIAVRAARKYKFSSSSVSKQCGTITFDFKLR